VVEWVNELPIPEYSHQTFYSLSQGLAPIKDTLWKSISRRLYHMLSADTPDVIALAEEILWKRVPSNTAVLTSLEEQKLKHSDSIPEMRQLLKTLGHQVTRQTFNHC
jgi:hypothetical protein